MKKIRYESAYEDRYPLQAVGEESYQKNLEGIVGYAVTDEKRYRDDSFTAELILDDENAYDRGNAVRVEIEGQTVGYLSKFNARKYRKALAALGLVDVIGVCGAAIAGRREDELEDMLFGVWLDIDLDNLKIESERTPSTQTLNTGKPVEPIAPVPSIALKPAQTKPAQQPAKKRFAIFIGIMLVLACSIPLCFVAIGMLQGILEIAGR